MNKTNPCNMQTHPVVKPTILQIGSAMQINPMASSQSNLLIHPHLSLRLMRSASSSGKEKGHKKMI